MNKVILFIEFLKLILLAKNFSCSDAGGCPYCRLSLGQIMHEDPSWSLAEHNHDALLAQHIQKCVHQRGNSPSSSSTSSDTSAGERIRLRLPPSRHKFLRKRRGNFQNTNAKRPRRYQWNKVHVPGKFSLLPEDYYFANDLPEHRKDDVHSFRCGEEDHSPLIINFDHRSPSPPPRFDMKPWPDGRIPYMFDGSHSEEEMQLFRSIVEKEFHQRTCVRFEEFFDSSDAVFEHYVAIDKSNGCETYVGWRCKGKHVVSLDCKSLSRFRQSVLHELMHVLGFHHEHQRLDREKYVKIIFENIIPKEKENFELYDFDTFGLEYDYYSITHYMQNEFGVEGATTIETMDLKYQSIIGRLEKLSEGDVEKIRTFYNC